ncbi:DUF4340 domain-containing protein [bacterium]|nr:DUF4340 domain-containing protein [bacterium]
MKIKTIYVLLFIFIAATLFVFLRDRSPINNGNNTDYYPKHLLLARNPNDITKCIFTKKDKTRIEFERSDSGWIITYPIITKGSKYSIDLMINAITTSLPRVSIKEFSDLSNYGLEYPNCVILLFSKNSSTPDTIQIGDKAPTSPECYFRIGSSREIILSSDISIDILDKSLFHFRNKELFDIDIGQINQLVLKSSKGDFSIEKSPEGWNWEGISAHFESGIVDGFLETLPNTLIYEFSSENIDSLAKFGLDKPKYSITLSTDKTDITIYFGNRVSDKIYARKNNLDKVLLVKSDILSIFD